VQNSTKPVKQGTKENLPRHPNPDQDFGN